MYSTEVTAVYNVATYHAVAIFNYDFTSICCASYKYSYAVT